MVEQNIKFEQSTIDILSNREIDKIRSELYSSWSGIGSHYSKGIYLTTNDDLPMVPALILQGSESLARGIVKRITQIPVLSAEGEIVSFYSEEDHCLYHARNVCHASTKPHFVSLEDNLNLALAFSALEEAEESEKVLDSIRDRLVGIEYKEGSSCLITRLYVGEYAPTMESHDPWRDMTERYAKYVYSETTIGSKRIALDILDGGLERVGYTIEDPITASRFLISAKVIGVNGSLPIVKDSKEALDSSLSRSSGLYYGTVFKDEEKNRGRFSAYPTLYVALYKLYKGDLKEARKLLSIVFNKGLYKNGRFSKSKDVNALGITVIECLRNPKKLKNI